MNKSIPYTINENIGFTHLLIPIPDNSNVKRKMFFEYVINNINTKLGRDGYIYLNQIYELFSIPWDPKFENILFNRYELDTQTISAKIEDEYVCLIY